MISKKQKMEQILAFLKKSYGPARHHLAHNRFQLLIGTVLSQRTRDENTEIAEKRLFSVAATPEAILKLPDKKLEDLIRPSGFYKQKAHNIKKICDILIRQYASAVPSSREDLISLPGVGFKTADVVLCYGFGRPTIPVDVHVEICSKRLGFAAKNAKYEEIRKNLEDLVPIKDRFLINLGFVEFGKEICRTYRPKCPVCELKNICEYYKHNMMIKAIAFDIGGVLLYDKWDSYLAKLEKEFGVKADAIHESIQRKVPWFLYGKGKISGQTFWKMIRERSTIPAEVIERLRKTNLDRLKPIPGIREMIKNLKKNYKVYSVTNIEKESSAYIKNKFDVYKLFDGVIMSFEVGSRKPEKKIFRVLLSKYHLKPAECVFIDYRDFNLVPAKEIGLKTILFKNPKQLEKDLRKIGVVF